MKYIFIFLISISSLWANGQNVISPITINLPANPPANTADWATMVPPVMILAQTKLVNGQINGLVQESKIMVAIMDGNNKVCGTVTQQNAPSSNFSSVSKNWTGAAVLSLIGQDCVLKPGSYQLCVRFTGSNMAASNVILGEACKPFTIPEKKQESFSPPRNINPTNEKKFTEAEIKTPITFRWTPIVPKPQEPVTYRLKVWQLMQGQNGANAMRSNQPIVEKDVNNITQAIVTNLYTGPCKPPYLCSYVWNVQAIDKEGKPVGSNKGMSEATSFDVSDAAPPSGLRTMGIKSLVALHPENDSLINEEDNKKSIRFIWTSVLPKPAVSVQYNLKIWEIKDGQTAEQARLSNKLLLWKTVYDDTSIKVNTNLLNLSTSKAAQVKFVWVVDANEKPARAFSGRVITLVDLGSTALMVLKINQKVAPPPPGCTTSSTTAFDSGSIIHLSDGYKLKLTETPTGTSDSLVGKGTVDVKWVGVLNVQFKGIKINGNDTLCSGAVYTITDSKQEYPTQWAINVLNHSGIPNWTTNKIKNLAAGIDSNKLTKPLIEAANSITTPASMPLNMPLGYFQNGDEAFGAIGFTEMVFKPTSAEFEVIVSLKTTKVFKETSSLYGTDAIALQGKGIKFTNTGLKGINGEIKLLEPITFNYASVDTTTLKMTFNKEDSATGNIGNAVIFGDTSSRFWTYKLDVNVQLPEKWLTPVDTAELNVNMNFQAQILRWDNFILQTTIPACTVPNTNGLGFEETTIVYDHSNTLNYSAMVFPDNYGTQESSEMFSGFYIPSFNMTLPDGLRSYADTTKQIRVGAENLIINKDGITGKIFAHNVLSYPLANVGNLAASIDTVDIELFKKTLTQARMNGKITLPMSSKDEVASTIGYDALFIPASASEDSTRSLTFTLKPDQDINSKFLGKGKVNIAQTSNLSLLLKKKRGEDRSIKLDIELNGKLYYPTGKIANPVNPSKPFDLELDCKFEGLKMNYDNLGTEKFTFKPGVWKFASGQKKLAGFAFNISEVKPVNIAFSTSGQYLFKGGIEFVAKINIGSENSKVAIAGDVKIQLLGGIKSSNFNEAGVDTTGPKKKFGFLSNLKPEFLGVRVSNVNVDVHMAPVDIKGSVTFYKDDAVYGTGFKGDIQGKFKTPNITISIGAIFGNTKSIPGNIGPGFKYWMVQAQVVIPPPGIVFMTGFAFRGFGAGVYSRMQMNPPATFNPLAANSTTFGGAIFTPDNTVAFGFKVKGIIATTPKEETFNGSVGLTGEFNTSGGMNFIQFDGTFSCGAKIGEENKAFATGAISVKYNFINKVFDLTSDLLLDVRSKGVDIYTPSPIHTVLYVNSKTNKWYFKSGTPTNPMTVKVFGATTQSYLMFGNHLGADIPTGFMQMTKDGWAQAGLGPMGFVDAATQQGKYKTAKGFAFGVAVKGGNSESKSIFGYNGLCWNTCRTNYSCCNFNYPCSESVYRYLNVGYSYIVGGEVDASLLQYNGCIGFNNGWRASVSAAIYAGVTVTYSANFPFSGCSGGQSGTLVSFRAGATAQAEFPNPSYFKGRVTGTWSVGGYSGSVDKTVEIGSQCAGSEQQLDPSINENEIYKQENAKDSLKKKLITSIVSPSSASDVNRKTYFSALLEYPYNEAFDVQEQQSSGEIKVRTFRVMYTTSLTQDSLPPSTGVGSVSAMAASTSAMMATEPTSTTSTSSTVSASTISTATVSSTRPSTTAAASSAASSASSSSASHSTTASTAAVSSASGLLLEDAGTDALGAKRFRLAGSAGVMSTVALKPNTSYKFQMIGIMQEKNSAGVWQNANHATSTVPIKDTKTYYFKTNSEAVGGAASASATPAIRL
jgi:hypothetical protein